MLIVIFLYSCDKKKDYYPHPRAKLKEICIAQVNFKDQKSIDRDSDGIGEYGFFQELSPKFLPNEWGKKAISERGIVNYGRYYYIIYLSGLKKVYDGSNISCLKCDIDLREQYWIAYAWPCEDRNYALACFVIKQDGEVYYFANLNKTYIGKQKIPEAWSALEKSNPSNTLTGKIGLNGTSYDGKNWEY